MLTWNMENWITIALMAGVIYFGVAAVSSIIANSGGAGQPMQMAA